ncbi:hypothetical protein IMG5_183860 [Ichthyophthirius multifiliis]|uniref:J domain-containing protein n=1 Tax=Ichthyophthirius multifiliis TaxID=5932 RepID=G0R388_ICHMU|nr:hypothetical protein IMG5_183860 [Ichthyophthirius multifiliis]EGR28062.1 hypothetical protein IMG5_183860 [Ichthyophthirius multifiliis]|eukprot:XP_004027407.1 hypothetical protein IMG5_183860 [Ichthyophthirius multifiliis]
MATKEQIQEVQQYMKIKDFYEILGIQKSATEEEIKKAYKKQALKFHPDKNQAPNSKEVFKKIAQAYDCLTDPQKRAFYDKYGDQQPEQHYNQYRQQFNDDISPENIFNMFFGGMNPFENGQSGVYYRQQYQQQRQQQQYQQQQQQQQGNKKGSNILRLLQMLPFFLIFFGGFLSNLLKEGPLYSTEYSFTHNIKKYTSQLKTTYYVTKNFEQKITQEPSFLKNVEQEIEKDYIKKLITECSKNQQLQRVLQAQQKIAQNDKQKDYYERELKKINLKSCRLIEDYELQLGVDINMMYS